MFGQGSAIEDAQLFVYLREDEWASLHINLKKSLVPFLKDVYPDARFVQDNDPKHCSKIARRYYKREGYQLVAHSSRVTRPQSN